MTTDYSDDTDVPVSVIVLAYGEEPYLAECVAALLSSEPVPEVLVVNNGADEAVASLPEDPRIRVEVPGTNLGFAAGCNFGARRARGRTLVFVNSDVRVDPSAIAQLGKAVSDPAVGLASAQVRLADEPDRINSVGNPVTFLMFSWAGEMGELASEHELAGPIVGICGATFATRREVWERLGGFDPEFFAYGEDMEISLRAWLLGYELRYEPQAVSWHHYSFNRNPLKMYLLERNRLLTLLTTYEKQTLRQLMPVIALTEVAVLAAAIRDGWAQQKIAGWVWLWQNRAYISRRQQAIAKNRVRDDAELVPRLKPRFDPPARFGISIPEPINRIFEVSWRRLRNRLGS